MYIPNTQKWIQYYQNLSSDGHNPYINHTYRGGKQIGGGSLSGSPQQFITSIGPPQKGKNDDKVVVNLVSPVQQSIDQAKDEVKRNMQGIKRKRKQDNVSSVRKRGRKQTQKGKPTSKETSSVKKLIKKKVIKKAVKRLTKQKSKKHSKKKRTTLKKKLKSTFNDIFSN